MIYLQHGYALDAKTRKLSFCCLVKNPHFFSDDFDSKEDFPEIITISLFSIADYVNLKILNYHLHVDLKLGLFF